MANVTKEFCDICNEVIALPSGKYVLHNFKEGEI